MIAKVVFVIDSSPERRRERVDVIRRAGYLPLSAPSLSHARTMLRVVRVDLVVSAAQLDDGRPEVLLRELRGEAALKELPFAVLGLLTEENRPLENDGHVHVREADDELTLSGLLAEVLGHSPSPE